MQRSPEEITLRAKLALADPKIISLVSNSASPSAAYDLVMAETSDQSIAKAARWLAVLRRDHSAKYDALTQATSSHVTNDKAKKRSE